MTSRPPDPDGTTHPSASGRLRPGVLTSLPTPRLHDLVDDVTTQRVVVAPVDDVPHAVLRADDLRSLLARSDQQRPVATCEDGTWSVVLPGAPVAGQGETLDEAVDDVVEALRDYAADWHGRLHDAPLHAGRWPLVALVDLSSSRALRRWVTGD